MGNEHTKPSEKLKWIDREVNSVRSSIRSTRRRIPNETKEEYIQSLAKFSGEVSDLKGKVKPKQLDQIQRNISDTMNEILTKVPQDSDLDLGAVETNSFVQVPINKRQSPNKASSEKPKKQKKNQAEIAKSYYSTLQDIEEKLKTLKPQVNVAIQIKDTTQLRVHQKTIKILATDLEMIEVIEDTPLGDKKKKLDTGISLQYQKISKAMKEIKRNKDMDYLLKQSNKEKALNELANIKTSLEEADSLLKTALRDNDSSAIKKIQDNLMTINQRLSSIEVSDEKTKSIKMQLMDKITWLCKYIKDSSKSNSQSDLSKAQSNYEDIVKNIASGNNKDKDEIKVKLQSLQIFINNIKENDESSLKRKQQLLNNVKQSFSFILEDEQNLPNLLTNTNSKPKNANTIYKELDEFYNFWKSVQKDIKSATYSDEESAKIEKVLDDIHKSIEQTRSHVSGYTKSPSNLNTKLNHSTPELRSPPIHPKFSSSLSVDQLGSNLIKTRVRLYNISTPEIQNINDQPVMLRNKRLYKSNVELQHEQRFSKIEEIRTQVNYIKEKFPESQQKQHLKNKLESYVGMLEQYVNHKNERTANNAKLLLEDVQQMLKSMNVQEVLSSSLKRRLSIEDSFENVVGIQEAVEEMTQVIENFSGTKDDEEYTKIKEELHSFKSYLQSMDIPPKYEMIKQQKEQILKKIDLHFDNLDSKCDEFDCYRDPDAIQFKRKLGSLRERVNRFSGAYKSVLYNSIERDLNQLLVGADDTFKDKNQRVVKGIVKDGEKLLKILEHRATKNQSFRRTISEEPIDKNEDKFNKLTGDLEDIKAGINLPPPHSLNSTLGLKSRLDLLKIGVDQIKIRDDRQKDIIYKEIKNLDTNLDARIASTNDTPNERHTDQDKSKDFVEELNRLYSKFEAIKQEIESFVGTTSDSKFYDLDECCTILLLKMEKMDIEQGTELYKKKINLTADVYNNRELLDRRVEETEVLVEIERAIHDVEKNFGRYVRLNDLENLESKVNALRDKISNSKLNRNLIDRKQACVMKIDDLVNKIALSKSSANKKIIEESTNSAEEFLSKTQIQLSNTKKEIETFVGIHADRKYYELHGNITGLFSKLDSFHFTESSNFHTKKNTLLKEINLYCDILDRKARDTEIIQEVTKQLGGINSKIDNYKGRNEELQVIKNELKSAQMKMDEIKLSADRKKILKSKYDILYGEYTRFSRALEAPKSNYIGSSTFVMDVQNKNKTSHYVPGSLESQIAEMQVEINEIKGKVKAFVDSDTSEEFRELEDTLLRLQVKLNKLPILNTELYNQRTELENEVQICLELLDERAQEADIIMDIEKKLDYLSKKLDSTTTEGDRNTIDEELISLQVQLGKLQVNDDLAPRKKMCTDRIIIYLRQLKKQSTTKEQFNS